MVEVVGAFPCEELINGITHDATILMLERFDSVVRLNISGLRRGMLRKDCQKRKSVPATLMSHGRRDSGHHFLTLEYLNAVNIRLVIWH